MQLAAAIINFLVVEAQIAIAWIMQHGLGFIF
jgi:hypothetical protein